MQTPQAIIFDMYGVLALNGWQAFKLRAFADKPEAWQKLVSLGEEVDAGRASYDDLVRYIAEATDETEETVRYQLEHTVANTELLDFIARGLKSQYKLGILSNARTNVVEQIFTPEQRALFDAVVLSYEVGFIKPDRRMYHTVLDRLGVSAEACLLVDDKEGHLEGAHKAGLQGLLFTDVAQLKRDIACLKRSAK